MILSYANPKMFNLSLFIKLGAAESLNIQDQVFEMKCSQFILFGKFYSNNNNNKGMDDRSSRVRLSGTNSF